MKALFGVVSLLVVLAIVGLVAVKQLKAVGQVGGSTAAAAAATGGVPALPQTSGSGTVRDRSRELQHKVAADAIKAMSQGAEARQAESDKP